MTLNFMNVGCVVLKIHTEQNIVNETLYSTFNDCVTIQEFALFKFSIRCIYYLGNNLDCN